MIQKQSYSNKVDDNEFIVVGKDLLGQQEIIDYIVCTDSNCIDNPKTIFVEKEPIEINVDYSIAYQILVEYGYKIKSYYEVNGNDTMGEVFYFIGIFSEIYGSSVKYSIYLVSVISENNSSGEIDVSNSDSMLFTPGDGIYFDGYYLVNKIDSNVISNLFQENGKGKELKTRYTFSYDIYTDGDFTLFDRPPDKYEHYISEFTFKSYVEAKAQAISTLQLMIDTHKGKCLDYFVEALESIKQDKPYYVSGNQALDIQIIKSME